MKKIVFIYWIATSIMSLIFLFSATMYLFNYEMVTGFFKALGFPVWLIYPLAILKILAVIAIVTKKFNFLKHLAYSGLLFDAILAVAAHFFAKDGGYLIGAIALIATSLSWFLDKKIYKI